LKWKNTFHWKLFRKRLKNDGGRYSIHNQGEHQHIAEAKKEVKPKAKGTGTFYCPMHCEGDKTYDKAGDCPVCGMDLVEEQNLSSSNSAQWTCPMHPEIVKDEAGACPICGMDLVPLQNDLSAEEKTYKKLLKKFWVASVFTLPIFLIAMSEMISNNPLYDIIRTKDIGIGFSWYCPFQLYFMPLGCFLNVPTKVLKRGISICLHLSGLEQVQLGYLVYLECFSPIFFQNNLKQNRVQFMFILKRLPLF
jgi:hypothetical protein